MKKSLLIWLVVVTIILSWCTVKDPNIQVTNTWDNNTGTLVFEDTTETNTETVNNDITKVRLYQLVNDPSNYPWVKINVWCEDSMGYFDAETDFKESEKYSKIFDLINRYDNEKNWYTNPWKTQDMVQFSSYERINDDRELNIYLSWTITLGGVCDAPRLIETMKSTYKWFGFDDVHLYLNYQPIEDALGGRWE